ncbi:siroheme synthase CysG [Fimbriimonas ginsengisoli]|uniref:Siroheme synthase n=1 Tax=Fimbriimonas ginsengisoli Gsoil 348 TaxID=661478 RepID=A0A068NNJ4_FIMGI|nr:siroheme synthase CysG [Fimbriimonas ginsengisoli]AIE84330.1 Siroheme synthase [Fimbriimonas ginsengisoli Gsoil 348]
MPYTQYHPVYLDLNDRQVLIVGGGSIALEKLNSLLPASGARITVISPEAREEIRSWHREGKLVWESRTFHPDDIEPAYMVIAATDDPDLNEWVYRCGNDRQRLTNSVDDPANCNFIMAALTRQGPMQVAVSSAGCSPALAQRVRNRIVSEILTEDLGELAEFLGDRRAEVKRRLPGYKVRQAFWERVLDSEIPGLLTRDKAEADAAFQRMLDRAVEHAPGDFSFTPAKVYIVGAGPGDPELITLRGLRALQRADVVLYDRLVHPDLLKHAPAKAEQIYVGKEVGHQGRGRQRSINDLLVSHARAGRTVVRLKGGDPFVFGRGGEEILALNEAGIEFEVIPGVSSAIAGPAAANIPVTHRGVSTAFAVFAGHEAEGRDEVPWDAAARMPTAVFLMGVERLATIAERLVSAGRSPETPVAVVSKATHADQVVAMGTLNNIVRRAEGIVSPAVIVVGEVVRVRETLDATVRSTLTPALAHK